MAGSTDRPADTAGIILAAGMSERMGRPKLLLPFQGRPILAHVIEQGVKAGLSPLILVLGHQADRIQDRIQTLFPHFPVDIVVNQDYPSGMASSILRGLKELARISVSGGPGPNGALFLLGDQPLVRAATIQRILEEGQMSPGRIITPTFRGRPGNPVYFDRSFFKPLMALSGDRGGSALFSRYPEKLRLLPLSTEAVCRDIDTPEDYETLIKHQEIIP